MAESIIVRTERIVTSVLKVVTLAMFVILTLILTLNIINRYIPITSFHWLDEIVEFCFAALVFYGAAALWISRKHFTAGDWITRLLPATWLKNLYKLVLEIGGLAFVLLFFYYSWQLMTRAGDVTAVFQIPKGVLYSCMPFSALIMVLSSIVHIAEDTVSMFRPPVEGTPK